MSDDEIKEGYSVTVRLEGEIVEAQENGRYIVDFDGYEMPVYWDELQL